MTLSLFSGQIQPFVSTSPVASTVEYSSASKVAICNRALTKLGARRILDVTDEVKEARELNSMWDLVRDAELRRNLWNFAMRRAALPALITTPAWGFAYEYQLPADLVRVVQVHDVYYVAGLTDYRTMMDVPFQVEGRKVLSDLDAPLKIRYVARVDDTQQWDALFVEAFASRLAYEACEAITQSNTKKEAAYADYQATVRQAKQVDAIENPAEPLPDSSWLLSRIP